MTRPPFSFRCSSRSLSSLARFRRPPRRVAPQPPPASSSPPSRHKYLGTNEPTLFLSAASLSRFPLTRPSAGRRRPGSSGGTSGREHFSASHLIPTPHQRAPFVARGPVH